jgi:MFS family permease
MARKHLRRNFFLGVLNGAEWQLSEVLIDASLVLTWFVSLLTSSNFLIGLIGPIRNGGWLLPQLLVSGYLRRQKRKLPLYRKVGIVRSASLGLLAASTFYLGNRQPALLLFCFFVCLAIFAFGGGFSGISFLDIVAKSIPARRRGSYFAWRSFLGGLLALGSGFWVRYVLDAKSGILFPNNFALLFFLAFLGITLAVIFFSLVIEPEESIATQEVSVLEQLRHAWRCACIDRNYARLIVTRILLTFAGGLAAPFYVIYAKNILHAPAASVGNYLLTLTLASIASNFLWGRLSDRKGNKAVTLVSCLVGIAIPLTAILLGSLGSLSLFFIPFALQGIYQSSTMIGHTNLVLDIAPAQDRPTYIGLINTILGLASLVLMVGGLLVDWLGFLPLFALAAIFFLLAFWVAWGLEDPHQTA